MAHAPPRRGLAVTADFVRALAIGPDAVSFALPDGRTARGIIEQHHQAADGSPVGVSGQLDSPGKGTFLLRVQPAGAATGPVVGAVVIQNENLAFRVLPGPDQSCWLTELPVDEVVCRSYMMPPEESAVPEEIPAEHPTNLPIPPYQNGIIPLQSRPGALGVIYLDYDGQTGPHQSWGSFDAAPPNASNTQIMDVWARVSEDFAPFNLNITTDLQVFLAAPETSRQRCIITPTDTPAPGAGGVAYVGTFGWGGDTPCWSFYATGKNATEVIAHEVGHTLGLFHDGRTSPYEEYYSGHGSNSVGWAPIMGVGYYKNLSQWSKGEYLAANRINQDDLAVIAANAGVGYRPDDAGATYATAALLEIFSGGAVNCEGTIETRNDVDAFRFTTTGGTANLSISPVSNGPNLDILASIYNSAGTLVTSQNPDSALNATLTATLAAGNYTVQVDGVGRGNPLGDGYTDYDSLGQYRISGTINGAVVPDRYSIAENSSCGTVIGVPSLHNYHAQATLIYSISSGNTGSAFALNSATGVITVATPAALNYEALSTNWLKPPTFNLTISVSDSLNNSLNESLRVVVSITNVNETPLLSGPSALVAISHLPIGTILGTVTASDPDTYDFVTLSIASGDPSGKFAISQTGVITTLGDLDAKALSSYTLMIQATDQATPPLTTNWITTVIIHQSGTITASITLGNLNPTYNGEPKSVSVTTSPPGLSVALTYDNSSTTPTNAGNYAIIATIINPLYTGNASATLVIAKSTAAIALEGLSQTYDGTPKSVVSVTDPPELAVDITYNGSPAPPSNFGTYAVTAVITDPNHWGTSSGTLRIRRVLIIAPAQTLVGPYSSTTYETLLNDGTLILKAGTIHITENATNHGTLRLTDDAALITSDTFINTGVIDVINWSGSLPGTLINTGTILDRSSIRVLSTQVDATTFSFTVPSYEGHLYQLESTTTLTNPWSPNGQPVLGTGCATCPVILPFSPTLDGPVGFYRVVVTPAP
jgi:hypothetical protein